MKPIRVIVAGSRYFNNYQLLKEKLDFYLSNKNKDDIEIVSGTARGADKLGERYAEERGIEKKLFKPDWDKIGKSAGMVRNIEMAKYATHLIAFTNGSKGTAHMIKTAKEYELDIRVVNF